MTHLCDYTRTERYFEQAQRIFQEIGCRHSECCALDSLGITAFEQGCYWQAVACYEQSLYLRGQIADGYGESRTLMNLANVLLYLADFVQAGAYYEEALQLSRQIGARHIEGMTLTNMVLLHEHQGQYEQSLDYGQQALRSANELGEQRTQGYALLHLGHAPAGLGRLGEAAAAYRQSLELRRAIGQHNQAIEALSSLARVALAQGDLARAQEHVQEILARIEQGSLDGTEEPFRIRMTCYLVLQAARAPQAKAFLEAAHGMLQERAGRIAEPEQRRSFLEDVRSHREGVAAYQALPIQDLDRQQVRLPRAGVPTGRPLREDEYVTVAWTIEAPADQEIIPKAARRQQRLLREAAEQGAAPTVDDPAAALEVSRATVKRDLESLRQVGHPVQTWGSR